MPQFARYQDGVMVVQSAVDRGVQIPSPIVDQRVFNKATTNVERWTGSAWVTDVVGAQGGTYDVKAGSTPAAGDGTTDDHAALATNDTAALALGQLLLFRPGAYRVSSNLTLSSPSQILPGAVLKPDAGVTITLPAPHAGPWKCFDTSAGGTIAITGPSLYVLPQWWGAKGDGSDDSAAINAAIATGRNVGFPQPISAYHAHTLVQHTQGQSLFAMGGAGGELIQIIKNASGDLFTSTAANVTLAGLEFRGESSTPSFTGHNIVSTGDYFTLWNCGSLWAFGRAVKATGNSVRIIGCPSIYQTADQTSAGYDVELGVLGTGTLYHQLHGVVSSQPTGGILLNDTGSQTILGGQFGKLTIAKGTSPAGANGGMIVGARILGNILVQLSNAILEACQFGAISITFDTGTADCKIGPACVYDAAATVTNNGNPNNTIIRDVSSANVNMMKWGGDSSLAVMTIDPATGEFSFPQVMIPNGKNVYFEDGSGVRNASISRSASTLVINNTTGGNYIGCPAGASLQLAFGSFIPQVFGGTGSPNSVVTAPVGSLYVRSDGGAATTLYVKESGTGNTGWVGK